MGHANPRFPVIVIHPPFPIDPDIHITGSLNIDLRICLFRFNLRFKDLIFARVLAHKIPVASAVDAEFLPLGLQDTMTNATTKIKAAFSVMMKGL